MFARTDTLEHPTLYNEVKYETFKPLKSIIMNVVDVCYTNAKSEEANARQLGQLRPFLPALGCAIF